MSTRFRISNLTAMQRLTALLLVTMISLQACSSVPRRIAPPQAHLVELRVLDNTPGGQRFAFEVTITNPNPEEIPVVRLDYDIRLGPAGRLIGQHTTPFTLPPQNSETLTVELVSDTVSSGSQLLSFAEDDQSRIGYEFHGELVLDSRLREPVPLFQRAQVPLLVEIAIR